ncbi:hypothetical protein DV515_00010769 [Chloebia gouldiae]|uniref:Uncharacterized protein n=1 Tax=Chloebia gouldiae TaxID=44316 RepID=A0A3L8S845_CHLGU|nr:hypothetical protein DV515_00010769 [Chloebia gouldiae]
MCQEQLKCPQWDCHSVHCHSGCVLQLQLIQRIVKGAHRCAQNEMPACIQCWYRTALGTGRYLT